MSDKRHLYSVYQRIKSNCCNDWQDNSNYFYEWYEKEGKKQQGLCHYCQLPGDTQDIYERHFRAGRRGIRLEVDRKDASGRYSPGNCVLACYPCNNAKSDVFSYEEFLEIGKAIAKVKKREAKSNRAP